VWRNVHLRATTLGLGVQSTMEKRSGLFLVLTDDAELVSTLVHIQPKGMTVRVWCPHKNDKLQEELLEVCEKVGDGSLLAKGDICKEGYFSQWQEFDPICAVLSYRDEDKLNTARKMITQCLPESIMLSFRHGDPENIPRTLTHNNRELSLTWAELLARPVSAELRHIQSTHLVKELRDVLDPGDKIAFLLQPDPDPDGLAASLALRNLLGRNKLSTPIVSFGKVTRPENLAMMRLLDIEVQTISPDDLSGYDRVVMLDTQPSHFKNITFRVDAIIDHHPVHASYSHIPFVDIRQQYGATSTILTEYLKAAACTIGQRLATALIYGIKADTLHLNREVIDADLDAFVALYPDINYNLLRKIEKPEIPVKFAPVLAEALNTMVIESNILVVCLGEVQREDLIPQIADFMLQFEDVEWVVCSGLFEGQVNASVRNVGYVRNAGDVVKRLTTTWGHGGGHRSMAKILFPQTIWKEKYGSLASANIRNIFLQMFLDEAV
jgi:nanoRNase/pAp phosphatase (c-di-AMP/oligoRNAs hydrolase)